MTVSLIEFILMVVVVVLQVIFRYILKISIPWTEELARVLYAGVIFFGLVLIEGEDLNIRTTYFIDKLPRKLCRAILIISNVLAIVFVAMLFVGGIILIRKTSVYMLASLPFITKTIFYMPIVIAAPFVIWELMKQIRNYIHYEPETNEGGGKE
jgi:TRAP-type C4-dicarboxylate transport system permease small subunit